MSTYTDVTQALDRGVEPKELCSTCPWDRHCVNPPTVSRAEVEAKTAPPAGLDAEDAGQATKALVRGLLDLVIYVGKDRQLEACPVLAAELAGPGGCALHDAVRTHMTTGVRV